MINPKYKQIQVLPDVEMECCGKFMFAFSNYLVSDITGDRTLRFKISTAVFNFIHDPYTSSYDIVNHTIECIDEIVF